MSAKACKYECGTLITWDNGTRTFKEQDGTPHTKERCESLKNKKASPGTNVHNEKQDAKSSSNSNNIDAMNESIKELAAAIRELAAAMIRRGQPI